MELANLIFMADRPPHEGDFTIESDRPVIFYVMGKALRAKLRTLRQQRAWDLYRFTLARYELLLGLPPRERDLTSFHAGLQLRIPRVCQPKALEVLGLWNVQFFQAMSR